MQKIETLTQLNVDLQFELPTLIERVGAFIIDFVIIIVAFSIARVFIYSSFAFEHVNIYLLLVSTIFMFYTFYMEALNGGRTIGKMALGLKVIKLNGKPCTTSDYLMRWIFRLIDIYFSLGSIAVLTINASNKGQRIGDFLAQTTVIKYRKELKIKADSIVNLKKYDNYTFTYPLAKEFSEEQMLLLKTTLDRYKKNDNASHELAIKEITDRILKALQLSKPPKDKIKFLQTVLNDYVVLTR